MASLSLQHINKLTRMVSRQLKTFNLEIEDKEFIISLGPIWMWKNLQHFV